MDAADLVNFINSRVLHDSRAQTKYEWDREIQRLELAILLFKGRAFLPSIFSLHIDERLETELICNSGLIIKSKGVDLWEIDAQKKDLD
jgi:hypothetical protein